MYEVVFGTLCVSDNDSSVTLPILPCCAWVWVSLALSMFQITTVISLTILLGVGVLTLSMFQMWEDDGSITLLCCRVWVFSAPGSCWRLWCRTCAPSGSESWHYGAKRSTMPPKSQVSCQLGTISCYFCLCQQGCIDGVRHCRQYVSTYSNTLINMHHLCIISCAMPFKLCLGNRSTKLKQMFISGLWTLSLDQPPPPLPVSLDRP